MTLDPFDAVLLLSFGGPDQPEDVVPFLENVTKGRGIPRERLVEVGAHYSLFGGRSPINGQNLALLSALEGELRGRGLDVPITWGNRNWRPYLVDALRELHAGGARRVAVILTSAYSSYSGCRQYRENLADALVALHAEGRDLEVAKVRHYFRHAGFVTAVLDGVKAALRELPEAQRDGARLVFVTHSVPLGMDEGSGPAGHAYTSQHRSLASLVADELADLPEAQGLSGWDLVFCSRSGPPHQPWLEPDVNDHLRELHAAGTEAVVAVPIGFVSDHMEVVFDLDTQAKATADELGLTFVRAATAGTHPAFVAGLVDLLEELAAQARGEQPTTEVVDGLPSRSVCAVGCCPHPRAERPAACGQDWPGAAAVAAAPGAAGPGRAPSTQEPAR